MKGSPEANMRLLDFLEGGGGDARVYGVGLKSAAAKVGVRGNECSQWGNERSPAAKKVKVG